MRITWRHVLVSAAATAGLAPLTVSTALADRANEPCPSARTVAAADLPSGAQAADLGSCLGRRQGGTYYVLRTPKKPGEFNTAFYFVADAGPATPAPVAPTPPAEAAMPEPSSSPVRLTGTDSGDVLTGTRNSDRLSGGNGDDVLIGNGNGKDRGKGADLLQGGPGNDVISTCGGSGTDFIVDNEGADIAFIDPADGWIGYDPNSGDAAFSCKGEDPVAVGNALPAGIVAVQRLAGFGVQLTPVAAEGVDSNLLVDNLTQVLVAEQPTPPSGAGGLPGGGGVTPPVGPTGPNLTPRQLGGYVICATCSITGGVTNSLPGLPRGEFPGPPTITSPSGLTAPPPGSSATGGVPYTLPGGGGGVIPTWSGIGGAPSAIQELEP